MYIVATATLTCIKTLGSAYQKVLVCMLHWQEKKLRKDGFLVDLAHLLFKAALKTWYESQQPSPTMVIFRYDGASAPRFPFDYEGIQYTNTFGLQQVGED